MMEMGLVGPLDESDNRSRILSAAAALFAERGYASTSLRAIANAVGMTPPALYWYFTSKQAILHALLKGTLLEFVEAVEAHVVGPAPQDKLRQFVRGHVRETLERPRIVPYEALFGYRQMARFLSDDERAELVAGQRRHLDLLRGTLREGTRCGCFRAMDVTATAFAILAICDYVKSWWRPDGPIRPDELAAHYEDLAMRMVAPGPPP